MNTSLIKNTIFIMALLIGAAMCSACAADGSSCLSMDDCPTDQICRLSACVTPQTTITTSDMNAQTNNTSNTDVTELPPYSTMNPEMSPDDLSHSTSCGGIMPKQHDLVIHEALMAVPSGPQGDANGDGVRDAYDDEFIELVNASEHDLQLKGVQVGVGTRVKWTFTDTCLPPKHGIVLFGGPKGTAPYTREDTLFLTAATRLSLSNQSGTLWLKDAKQQTLFRLDYDAPKEASYTLTPQITGRRFIPHDALDARLFSPGLCADGQPLSSGCPAPSHDADMSSDHPGVEMSTEPTDMND